MASSPHLPRPEDLRAYPRAAMRTCLTVICPDGMSPLVYKAWTEDISACGVQFSCDEEIASERVLVRLLLPGLEGKLVECELVRSAKRQSETVLRRTGPRFTYGARFQRVLTDRESEDMLGVTAAFGTREPALVG